MQGYPVSILRSGAAQITAQQGREDSGTNGGIGTQAVVLAFWMGTPETSREPVRRVLEQTGLWKYLTPKETA